MRLYYTISAAESKRYLAACDRLLEQGKNVPRLNAKINELVGDYISVQTLRDWLSEPGRIPTDVAVKLVKYYDGISLVDLCPWLKGLVNKKGGGR